jgi:hypothetical protein
MDSYSEAKFLSDFKKKYDMSGEYDYTIIFDDYYSNFIERNSPEFIENVYKFYYKDESFNNDVLYETLYNIVEVMMLNNYESEAETDTED